MEKIVAAGRVGRSLPASGASTPEKTRVSPSSYAGAAAAPPIGIWTRVSHAIQDMFTGRGGDIQQSLYRTLLLSLVEALLREEAKICPGNESWTMLGDGEKVVELRDKILIRFGFDYKQAPRNELERHLHGLFAALFSVTQTENYAQSRSELFKALNAAYSSEPYQVYLRGGEKTAHVELLQFIGYAIFTQAELHTLAHEAVRTVSRGSIEQGDVLSRVLCEDHQCISEASSQLAGGVGFTCVQKLVGTLNTGFAPLERTNYASKLGEGAYRLDSTEYQVEWLRFGTPTAENGQVQILPQFRLFLDWCRENKKTIVSFQLQNPADKKGGVGDEHQRLEALLALAQKDYPNVLKVIGLPMDGPFFKHIGYFSAERFPTIGAFKAQLMDIISGRLSRGTPLVNNGPFEWNFNFPPDIQEQLRDQESEVYKEIKTILNQVHAIFFAGREKFEAPHGKVSEATIFQLIVYTFLQHYFIAYYQGDYTHSQCKDAMDRAMSLVSLNYYIQLLQTGQEGDLEKLEEMRTLVHHAPLFIKGIAMHGERFAALIASLEHLEKLDNRQKQAVRAMRINVLGQPLSVSLLQVAKRPNQSLYPLPSAARNIEEYWSSLAREYGVEHTYSIARDPRDGVGADQFEKDLHRSIVRYNGELVKELSFWQDKLQALARTYTCSIEHLYSLMSQGCLEALVRILTQRYAHHTLNIHVMEAVEAVTWDVQEQEGSCVILASKKMRIFDGGSFEDRPIQLQIVADLRSDKLVMTWTIPPLPIESNYEMVE